MAIGSRGVEGGRAFEEVPGEAAGLLRCGSRLIALWQGREIAVSTEIHPQGCSQQPGTLGVGVTSLRPPAPKLRGGAAKHPARSPRAEQRAGGWGLALQGHAWVSPEGEQVFKVNF